MASIELPPENDFPDFDTESKKEDSLSLEEINKLTDGLEGGAINTMIDSEDDKNPNQPPQEQQIQSKDTKAKKLKAIKILIFLVIIAVMSAKFFLFSDDTGNKPQQNAPVAVTPTNTTTPTQNPNVLKQARVEKFSTEIETKRREVTLKQINQSQQLAAVIQQLKRDFETLRDKVDSKNSSGKALISNQKQIFKSLKLLNTYTSSKGYKLADGGSLTPSANGYTLTSGAGIQKVIKDSTFIAIPRGAIIKSRVDSSMTFVFFPIKKGDGKKILISNIYNISPIYGLKEQSNSKRKEDVKKLLLSKQNNMGTTIDYFDNQILFFNSKSELAATKEFIITKKVHTNKNNEVPNSERKLTGFITDSYTTYLLDGGRITIDGEYSSIDGISNNMSLRYVEYKGTDLEKTITRKLEIISNGETLKTLDMNDIVEINLKSTIQKSKTYLDKGGDIYVIGDDLNKLLLGVGRIAGVIVNGSIVKEVVSIEEETEKYSPMSKLSGMTLFMDDGQRYVVSEKYITVKPSNQVFNIEDYMVSSSGNIVTSETKLITAKIVRLKNTNKVGGVIMTKNHKVVLKSLDTVLITNRNTTVTKKYNNPKIKFTKKGKIIISIKSSFSDDSENKLINGISYTTKEKVTDTIFRYVLNTGDYFNPSAPEINLDDTILIDEFISDVELIEGNILEYFYEIDTEKGIISNNKLGQIILDKQLKKFKIFQAAKKTTSVSNKTKTKVQKDTLSIEDLINMDISLQNLTFKAITGESVVLVSDRSILLNKMKYGITKASFNTKRNFLTIELDSTVQQRDVKRITGSSQRRVFELSIKDIVPSYKNYYTDSDVVITAGTEKVIKTIVNGTEVWTKVYKESVDIRNKTLKLKIKPFFGSTKTFEEMEIGLSDKKEMPNSMFIDIQKEYFEFIKDTSKLKKSSTTKSTQLINNTKILESELKGLEDSIGLMLGKNLTMTVDAMSAQQQQILKKKIEKEDSKFAFEVGTELTYRIRDILEIPEGSESFIYTDLEQTYLEDREGNSLEMNAPVVILKVLGDFNTNKAKFFPVKIIFTDMDGKREIIDIPDAATKVEFEEDDTGYKLDGVPSYYVNQKMTELPTTVMLSTLQGLVDSMTAPDEGIAGALGGLSDIAGGGEEDETSAFTEGVASGASSGIKEILDVYKEKSEGKQDLLITPPDLSIKSIFIQTFIPGSE